MNDQASSQFVLEHLEDAFKEDSPHCGLAPQHHNQWGNEEHIFLYSRYCPTCNTRYPVVMCLGCRDKLFKGRIKHKECNWYNTVDVMTLVEVLK